MSTDNRAGPIQDSKRTHSDAVREIYRRMLSGSPASGRRLVLRSGLSVQVLEAGEGPPVLHLHGSSTSSLSHLPLLERCTALRSVAVDRPGFGLSQPTRVLQRRFRESAIDFVGDVLDELQWRSATVVGGSMGGTWALWYALAHPERVTRLVLLGSAPLLPGTRPPAPLRTATTPLLGELLVRFAKPNARILQRLMATVGEGDTIIRYPDLVDALVAAAHDRVAAETNLAELRAVMSVLGFRASVRIRTDELRDLRVPTLLIWGDSDPVGSVEAARTAAELIPDARLEVLPAGHVPWLGNPDRVAGLLSTYVLAG